MTNKFIDGLSTYLSKDQINRIQSKHIGIGGAGGLGSNVAMILVRTGFTNLEILDQDVIEPSNLNRQQYFLNEIGRSKVLTLEERLLQINPEVNIIVHETHWTPENGQNYFPNCDIVVEAFDHAEHKYKFVDFYQDRTHFVISGNGMAGLIEKEPMRMQKLGNVYFVGDASTDTHLGHPPLAPRVTQCAAMMAEIILDLTLEIL